MKNNFTRIALYLLAIIQVSGIAAAQPDQHINPLGPNSSFNITGPWAAKHIPDHAPRIIAATSDYIVDSNGRGLTNSTQFIYPSATALKYNQALYFRYKNGELVSKSQSTYILDPATGAAISSLSQKWNATTGTYVNLWRSAYLNDAEGRAYDVVTQTWDSTIGEYVNDQHHTDIYNSEGYLVDRKEKFWDRNTVSWNNRRHSVYTRNAQNNITSEVRKYWSGASAIGENPTRFEYTYDLSGLILLRYQMLSRDALGEHWQPNIRNTCTSNAAGKPASLLTETWYSGFGKWDTLSRVSYTYDVSGNETAETTETYNRVSHRFANSRKTGFVYNNFNQLTSRTTLFWVSGAWKAGALSFRSNNYYENSTCPVNAAGREVEK